MRKPQAKYLYCPPLLCVPPLLLWEIYFPKLDTMHYQLTSLPRQLSASSHSILTVHNTSIRRQPLRGPVLRRPVLISFTVVVLLLGTAAQNTSNSTATADSYQPTATASMVVVRTQTSSQDRYPRPRHWAVDE